MHTLKLRAVGSSTGVIIPRELLEKLNVKIGDELFVTETSLGSVLTPSNPDVARQLALGKEELARYREVFEALAK